MFFDCLLVTCERARKQINEQPVNYRMLKSWGMKLWRIVWQIKMNASLVKPREKPGATGFKIPNMIYLFGKRLIWIFIK